VTLIRIAVLIALSAVSADAQSLDDALRQFYSGRYEAAAARASQIRSSDPANLAASELRSSALLFQIKRAVGEAPDKAKAWQLCASCAELMTEFLAETTRGQTVARAALKSNPADDNALFYLGKLDLNYVWLQLGTLGKRTGWSEYWEARKSLDAVLKTNPGHVRARVARAWIDYIVDTKLPRGTRWMLGGGNKKKGLQTIQQAAESATEPFVQAEAKFGLWDMQVRERQMEEAVVTARALARDFPDNAELAKFLARHDSRPNFTSAAVR